MSNQLSEHSSFWTVGGNEATRAKRKSANAQEAERTTNLGIEPAAAHCAAFVSHIPQLDSLRVTQWSPIKQTKMGFRVLPNGTLTCGRQRQNQTNNVPITKKVSSPTNPSMPWPLSICQISTQTHSLKL